MKIKSKKPTQIVLTLMLTLSALLCGYGKAPEVALEERILNALQKDRKLAENKSLKEAEDYRRKREKYSPSDGPSLLEEIQEKAEELRRMKEEQERLSTEL